MTERVKILAEQIRQLTVEERHDLLRLFDGIDDEAGSDGTPEEIEQAWINEVERRIESVERGETTLIPAEVVHAELRAKLQHRR